MLNLVLPKIECDASSRNYGRFIIGPLESGYGITLGNALRRVLLSSLPGAAVTSIRISGIHHEFSAIPYVKEDTTALILNVKQLRLKLQGDESARLRLEVKGEGEITAGDIECPSQVEIVNPDLHLLTADSSEAELDMELVVEHGKGYSPAEERGQLPIGEIPVDAVFSPIRKANFVVERARVGQMTNFDRLIMEIWTDGTIEPEEALSSAAQILVEHLSLLVGVGEMPPEEEKESVEELIPSRIYETPIEDLELSVRAYNCLKRAGITKVGEILERMTEGEDEILAIRNFGKKSLAELKERMQAKGLWPLNSEETAEEMAEAACADGS
ncbi:MAG TPA: DNA-directed RNA polymerase subunit alpha [Anaerolineae bacterium]|nr:DNA-directed RNA polymerase subunit alpha [Anaerolineae bacterium]